MDKGAETYQDTETPRFRWTEFEVEGGDEDDGSDVIEGLTSAPKYLPARYFYDEAGSALFERITGLPEYYPTRTEQALLDARADEIAAITGPAELVELGSGSARKTRALLDAYAERDQRLRYLPVDVSAGIVKDSSRELVKRYPALDVWALVGTYEQALAELPPRELDARMAVFLGSTLGNLNSDELGDFLDTVRGALPPGAYFLVGADLQKQVDVLEAAYNDAEGVTAAFNLNILRHLNERFDGDFDLDAFRHKAFYNREEQQIEMHLAAQRPLSATLDGLDLTVEMADGETIHTEISRKFNVADLGETITAHGFEAVRHWTDPQDWFALMLFKAV